MFKVKEALNELFAEKLNDPLSKEGFVLKRRNAFQRKIRVILRDALAMYEDFFELF